MPDMIMDIPPLLSLSDRDDQRSIKLKFNLMQTMSNTFKQKRMHYYYS